MPKPRARQTPASVEDFINAADQPATAPKPAKTRAPAKQKPQKKAVTARTTISLPKPLLDKLEEIAFSNKRQGLVNDSVSALAREAITLYLKV